MPLRIVRSRSCPCGHGPLAELVDAPDSKSGSARSARFDSGRGHHYNRGSGDDRPCSNGAIATTPSIETSAGPSLALQHRRCGIRPLGGGRSGPRRAVRLPRGGAADRLTFGELSARSNALANGLPALGIRRGDRVALLLPQSFEMRDRACGHLQARRDRGAAGAAVRGRSARIPASDGWRQGSRHNRRRSGQDPKIGGRLPALEQVLVIDGAPAGAVDFWKLVADHPPDFDVPRDRPG